MTTELTTEEAARLLGLFDERWLVKTTAVPDHRSDGGTSDRPRHFTWAGLCPGCGNWSIQYPHPNTIDLQADVTAAVRDHRAECPAFDMLAALQGIPTHTP